jgi:hypothetical protein
MMMFHSNPNPKPRTSCPASHPAIAPTMIMTMMLSIPTTTVSP